MLQNCSIVSQSGFNSPLNAEARFISLTLREREILFELVKVGNIKLVAKNLTISPFTVNQHLRSIYTKLGVKTKLEAVMFILSYAHCQTTKVGCKKPEDLNCKARGVNGCDVMVCFLASLCAKDGFCFLLGDDRSQCGPKNDYKYISANENSD